MSTAEITAYLEGVNIGRRASVLTLNQGVVEIPDGTVIAPNTAWACRFMSGEEFRYWLLRGVGDAFRE
jgi:hypothetical protein